MLRVAGWRAERKGGGLGTLVLRARGSAHRTRLRTVLNTIIITAGVGDKVIYSGVNIVYSVFSALRWMWAFPP